MTTVIAVCLLLLLAYIFDITSSKTRVPSVVLLLLLGFTVKVLTNYFVIDIPDLNPILPILGTIGLILIVLEGSLELDINKSKLGLIYKASVIAVIPMIIFCIGLAYLFKHISGASLKICLANAIPFAVISSAIAIPSAKNLSVKFKEFITYESSLSDIVGVIFFNFIVLNEFISMQSVNIFIIELIYVLIISIVATIGLAYLLSRIKHSVKSVPIILIIVLIYTFAKELHLPALVLILVFGLLLGNFEEISKLKLKFMEKINFGLLGKEIHKFQELTSEITFLIRALFFLVFGFLIDLAEVLNVQTLLWAFIITISIFLLRAIFLMLLRLPTSPLFYFAPRGLITILLFLSIPIKDKISIVNESLIIQVIILTAFIMMFGLIFYKNNEAEEVIEANCSNDSHGKEVQPQAPQKQVPLSEQIS